MDELLEPFTTAVAAALREMAGAEVVVRNPSGVSAGAADVSAGVRLTAGGEGWLVLSFPPATAAALARRVLAEVGGEPDDGMIRDCVGELVNVTAGQAKALLSGTPRHFTFSTPTAPPADPAGAGWSVVTFDSDAGEFRLHLYPPPGRRE